MFSWLKKKNKRTDQSGQDQPKGAAAKGERQPPPQSIDPSKPASDYDQLDMRQIKQLQLVKNLEDNIATFQQLFKDDSSIILRRFQNAHDARIKGCAIYFEGMVNSQVIAKSILTPLIGDQITYEKGIAKHAANSVITSAEVKEVQQMDQIISNILYGDTVLLLDGDATALLVSTKGFEKRSIAEPDSEKVLRGPREGFTESMVVNMSMLRRKVRSHRLRMQYQTFGTASKTAACICYIEGIARPEILEELKKRLSNVDLDGVLDINYITEFLQDKQATFFRTIGSTERPDVVAGKLIEGRIALMLDGSPSVLTLPYLFMESFQEPDDYTINPFYASFARILRISSYFLSITVPALYMALTTFHPEMIPTQLLVSLTASRMNVPFPTIVEMTLILIVFDILREAGLRMPASVGQALSIVGALVIGQAAVEAKIVSAPIIIVVGVTGITALMVPRILGTTIGLRFAFLLLASFLGLYGIIFGMGGLFLHLFNLTSFGIPVMTPLTIPTPQDIKDILWRRNWTFMRTRPSSITDNHYRTYQRGKKSVTNQPMPIPRGEDADS